MRDLEKAVCQVYLHHGGLAQSTRGEFCSDTDTTASAFCCATEECRGGKLRRYSARPTYIPRRTNLMSRSTGGFPSYQH